MSLPPTGSVSSTRIILRDYILRWPCSGSVECNINALLAHTSSSSSSSAPRQSFESHLRYTSVFCIQIEREREKKTMKTSQRGVASRTPHRPRAPPEQRLLTIARVSRDSPASSSSSLPAALGVRARALDGFRFSPRRRRRGGFSAAAAYSAYSQHARRAATWRFAREFTLLHLYTGGGGGVDGWPSCAAWATLCASIQGVRAYARVVHASAFLCVHVRAEEEAALFCLARRGSRI